MTTFCFSNYDLTSYTFETYNLVAMPFSSIFELSGFLFYFNSFAIVAIRYLVSLMVDGSNYFLIK